MASMPGIVLRIGANTADAVKGINQVEGRLDKFAGRARSSAAKIGKGIAIGLGTAAAAGAAVFADQAVDAVKGAIEEDKAIATLNKTIENLGFKKAEGEISDFIDVLAKTTTATDDDLRPAFGKLLTTTRDVESAQRLMRDALDLSAASGVPLATAVSAIAKAQDGSYVSLKKLLPGLESLKGKTPKVTAVMEDLRDVVGGSAAAQQNTLAGGLQQVQDDIGELKDAFGHGFVDALTGKGGAAGATSDFSKTLQDLQPFAEDLGESLAGMAQSLAEVSTYLGPVVEKFNELNDMGDGILTDGTLSTVFGKIVPGVQFIAAKLTGNEQAATEANIVYAGGEVSHRDPSQPRKPYVPPAQTLGQSLAANRDNPGSKTNVDPSRVTTQQRNTTSRANSRSAQRSAKTNARP